MNVHTAPGHPVPGLVVVATDGTTAGKAGIRFATREARRLGLGLELVHVVPSLYPVGTFPVIPDDTFRQFGRDVLQEGFEVARAIDPDVRLGTTLMTGGRVSSIISCAREAALIVLGSHPLSPAERFWAGATVPGVAARAHCPVLTVPAQYDSTKQEARVVVGVKDPARSADLLASAFSLADALESELVIVHAWKLPPGYDDLVSNQESREEWRVDREAAIESELGDLRRSHPDVRVRMEIVHGQAAAALVNASIDAQRLVITRPVHGSYFHHLGSTARAVLREARCPVEVFPPTSERAVESLEAHARSVPGVPLLL